MSDGPGASSTPQIRRSPAPEQEGVELDVGLCLSGGGFRAMLFHAGSLWRLNEAGYLPRLDRVSSVSGGSITAAVLALAWSELEFGSGQVASNYTEAVVEPLRTFAGRTIDVPAVLLGTLAPFLTINGVLTRRYGALFGKRGLQDLPDRPEFVFDATSLQSGDLWRFSKDAEGDWRVGRRLAPDTPLAQVVAASSAFPPLLSPARLSYPGDGLEAGSDASFGQGRYRTRVVLADGGVYDNLGLEAVWASCRQVLISDAGGHMANVARPRGLWPLQLLRVLQVIDNQVRDLRKRQAVVSYQEEQRTGAYWGIRSHVRDYGLSDPIAQPADAAVEALAGVPTRLAALSHATQERLINWGYVMGDTALRAHVDPTQRPGVLPYPESGLS